MNKWDQKKTSQEFSFWEIKRGGEKNECEKIKET